MSEAQPEATTRRPIAAEPVPRYAFIDALRGWAFLAVCAVHCAPHVPMPLWLSDLCQQGNHGVQLFFVASALTLFMSMDARIQRDRHPSRAFLLRRFARIAPMFWIATAFYLWHYGTAPRGMAPDGIGLAQVLTTLSFTHGWHPATINALVPGGWSIAVEMNFYLLVPICFGWITSLRRAVFVLLVTLPLSVAVSIATNRWLAGSVEPGLLASFTYYWLPRQAPVFALGFVLHFLIKQRAIGGAVSKHDRALVIGGMALVAASLVLGGRVPLAYFGFSLAATVLALGLARDPIRLLVNAPVRYVGKLSFSAYLVHFFVIDMLAKPVATWTSALGSVLPFVLLYTLAVLFTALIASVTYQQVELRGQRAGNRFIQRFGWGT